MPLVQQEISRHFGKPPRKGVHPDECVALGAALLADSLREHRRGHAARRAVDADRLRAAERAVPEDHRQELRSSRSRRASACRGPRRTARSSSWTSSRATSEFIVDNEYLGTVKVPASAAGRRIDFRLNEECLLEVVVELDAVRGTWRWRPGIPRTR